MMVPDEIWTGKECAAYLKMDSRYFMETVRHRKTFPEPLAFNEGGRPRWSSTEVRQWALGGKETKEFMPYVHHVQLTA